MGRTRIERAKVVQVVLEQPLAPIEVDLRYRDLVLIVRAGGIVVGRVTLPATSVVTPDVQRQAIAGALGDRLWRFQLDSLIRNALPAAKAAPRRTVSVVVCTRDRTDRLSDCLESLLRLRTPPEEIIVVDNCPSDDSTQSLCCEFPVRYVREDVPGESRARNRGVSEAHGDVIAFTDDDCVVDAGWLDNIDETFRDELVLIVNGYVGPAEIETRAQWIFEQHGGFERGNERIVFDASTSSPVALGARAGVSANVFVRRRFFEEVAMFAEDLGAGTPACAGADTYANYCALAAGYRVVFDPSQVVWHHHRREYAALRKLLHGYGVSVAAYTLRCLLVHRETGAIRVLFWWWTRTVLRDLGQALIRREGALPVGLALAQAQGTLVGPWRLARSALAHRRGADAIPMPTPAADPPQPRPAAITVGHEAGNVSVVVPSHNRQQLLQRVLQALAVQSYPAERIEVIVVLDGCSDDSATMARSLPLPYRLAVLESPGTGAGAARNRGVDVASSELVVFLDDDIVPEPTLVAAHAAGHNGRSRRALLGYCPPVVPEAGLWEQSVRAWWEDHYRRQQQAAHQWTFTDFAVGNASMARSLFLETGGFDESFRGRREDWELGVRLLRNNAEFAFERAAIAQHHLDASFPTTLRLRRLEARADVQLARKHPGAVGSLGLIFVAQGLETGFGDRVFRHARAGSAAARLARPGLTLLESAGARTLWTRAVRAAVMQSYVAGVADVTDSPDELLAVIGAGWRDAVPTASLDLAVCGSLVSPVGVGPADLRLDYQTRTVSTIAAVQPNGQWDWHAVGRRVADAAGPALQEALVRERLLQAINSQRAPLLETAVDGN